MPCGAEQDKLCAAAFALSSDMGSWSWVNAHQCGPQMWPGGAVGAVLTGSERCHAVLPALNRRQDICFVAAAAILYHGLSELASCCIADPCLTCGWAPAASFLWMKAVVPWALGGSCCWFTWCWWSWVARSMVVTIDRIPGAGAAVGTDFGWL